jgi:hypothetical protein
MLRPGLRKLASALNAVRSQSQSYAPLLKEQRIVLI